MAKSFFTGFVSNMQISKYNSKTNFGGIPLGVAKVVGRDGKEAKLSLYKLTKNDDKFLEKLGRNIETRKLQDGFTEDEYSLWNEIIISGISECRLRGRGFLVAKDNVPCGVLAYLPRITTTTVKDVATWPVDKNKKVPFAGKALFMELFKEILNGNSPQISLVALKESVYSPAEHYKSIGFRKSSEAGWYINMKIVRSKIQKSLKELEELIDFTPAQNLTETDLTKELRIKKRKISDIFKIKKD